MEGTAAVAMAALDAVFSRLFKRQIVFARQIVAQAGEIVVLVDQRDVQPRGTWVAVLTVDALGHRVLGRVSADERIVALFGHGFKEIQHLVHFAQAAVAGQYGDHAGLVQRVLQTLVFGQRSLEGGLRRVQQLTAAERLHDRDAHAFLFAAAIKRLPVVARADAEIALTVIVDRIDGEHHHVDDIHVQHAIDQRRRMRGQADVTDHALLFQREHIVHYAVFLVCVQILVLVKAVDEAEIDVVGSQMIELPGDGSLDFVQSGRPAVFAAGVVRAEMHLQIDLTANVLERLSVGRKDGCVAARHVEVVHAALAGRAHRFDDLLLGPRADDRRAHADHADFLAAARQCAIVHSCFLLLKRPCAALFVKISIALKPALRSRGQSKKDA